MVADNNLNNDAIRNINQMISYKKNYQDSKKNLLVYIDGNDIIINGEHLGDKPQLIKITGTGKGFKILKTYPEQNSVSPEIMNKQLIQATRESTSNHYGLILWSHGSSWLPKSKTGKEELKSFGNDNGEKIDMFELQYAIPPNTFEFIMFDACAMGSIECAYELKDKAEYIMASAAEVMASGYPYNKMLPHLFKEYTDYQSAALEFYNYYNAKSSPDGHPFWYNAGCISVIETRYLSELALNTRKLLRGEGMRAFYSVNRNDLQILAKLPPATFGLYDFENMVKHLGIAKISRFEEALQKAVKYKYSTPKLYSSGTSDKIINVKTFCGLSSYCPQDGDGSFSTKYKQLAWYRDCYE